MNRAQITGPQNRQGNHAKAGFTLVELLVVITIIGLLVAIAIPTLGSIMGKARDTANKFEVTEIADAVEKYYQKHNDYPPDGSDLGVLQRHFRKLFPRMQEPDGSLLVALTHVPDSNNPTGPPVFSPVAMDRAEALLFFLGGFSDDLSHPITGPGGPLVLLAGATDLTNLASYQYNMTRSNSFLTLEPDRIDVTQVGNRYVSNDEVRYEYTGTDLSVRGGNDLLPTYLSDNDETPVVYFDSRTYGDLGGGAYNGYLIGGKFGGVRPYKTSVGAQEPPATPGSYGSATAAFNAVPFMNPTKYQIIHPGQDGVFGALVQDATTPTPLPVHFMVDTGGAVSPYAAATSLDELEDIVGYGRVGRFSDAHTDDNAGDEISDNGNLDNFTNFADNRLGDALP